MPHRRIALLAAFAIAVGLPLALGAQPASAAGDDFTVTITPPEGVGGVSVAPASAFADVRVSITNNSPYNDQLDVAIPDPGGDARVLTASSLGCAPGSGEVSCHADLGAGATGEAVLRFSTPPMGSADDCGGQPCRQFEAQVGGSPVATASTYLRPVNTGEVTIETSPQATNGWQHSGFGHQGAATSMASPNCSGNGYPQTQIDVDEPFWVDWCYDAAIADPPSPDQIFGATDDRYDPDAPTLSVSVVDEYGAPVDPPYSFVAGSGPYSYRVTCDDSGPHPSGVNELAVDDGERWSYFSSCPAADQPLPMGAGSHSVALTLADVAGNQSATLAIDYTVGTQIDASCDPPSGAWSADDITVHCTASAGSVGMVAGDEAFDLTAHVDAGTESSDAQTDSRLVCSLEGTCITVGPFGGYWIDKKDPSATISSPVDGAAFYPGSQPSADYSCSDGASGVASCIGDLPQLATLDGSPGQHTLSVTATDGVGNTSTSNVTYTILVDSTPPTVGCGPTPTSWARQHIIHCSATDAGIGMRAGDSEFSLTATTPDGTSTSAGSTGSKEVCDLADNCVTAGPITGLKLDRKLPTAAVVPSHVAIDHQISAAEVRCADADAGMPSIPTCLRSSGFGTSTAGSGTGQVFTFDRVSNGGFVTASYTVDPAPSLGARMVYVDTGNAELVTVDSDGSNPQRLGLYGALPAFSPDGTKIAWNLSETLWVANADGTGAHAISPRLPAELSPPNWSPDGAWINTSYKTSPTDGKVYRYRSDGSMTGELLATVTGSELFRPTWSPDGTKVMYESGGNGAGTLTVADAVPFGANAHVVATDADGDQSWSPGGSKIAYLSSHVVKVINADGSGAQTIPMESQSATFVDWTGDGNHLLVVNQPNGAAYRIATVDLSTGYASRGIGVTGWQAKWNRAGADHTAPIVDASVTGTGSATFGIYANPVTVHLAGTDEPGGSGVGRIEWSAAGGQPAGLTTVTGASADVPISATGVTTVSYRAYDVAGNASALGTVAVRIDPRPVVSIADATSVLEPDESGIQRGAYFQVNLSRPAATDLTFSYYTRDGTATGCTNLQCDYNRFGSQATPRTETIKAGTTQYTFSVPVNSDNVVESDETFDVVVVGVSSGAVLSDQASTTVTIVDPDRLSQGGNAVLLLTPKNDIVEGDAGTQKGQIIISLSKPLAQPITITYQTSDLTAHAPGDYRAIGPTTVTIPAGTRSKTIDVAIVGNTIIDGYRELAVNHGAVVAPGLVDVRSAAVVGILDDDDPLL